MQDVIKCRVTYMVCVFAGNVRNQYRDDLVQSCINTGLKLVGSVQLAQQADELLFPSTRDSGRVWRVQVAGGHTTCSCPRFDRLGVCKHVACALLRNRSSAAEITQCVAVVMRAFARTKDRLIHCA